LDDSGLVIFRKDWMQQAMQVLCVALIASDPGEKSLGYNVDEMPFAPSAIKVACITFLILV